MDILIIILILLLLFGGGGGLYFAGTGGLIGVLWLVLIIYLIVTLIRKI